MALEALLCVFQAHSETVINDTDFSSPAVAKVDLNPPRSGIQGILDKLLDNGGGALDDLAGRNLIYGQGIEKLDARERGKGK